jgi:ABC-type Mn2+/Zn2+ transport system permease subunit
MLGEPASILALVATAALAIACSGLSVLVVARRWAFIGEGIAHAGFGGAGLGWLIMLIVPSLMGALWVPYAAIITFCLLTALGIGYVSRTNRVSADTAIGIFMVASLAFGFLVREIFLQVTNGLSPPGFADILFGRFSGISPRYSYGAIAVCVAVIVTLLALGKEMLFYCLDPLAAKASGVAAGFIHYLLMVLIALVVVIGIPITGSVLVTALLILPAATANLVSQKLLPVIVTAVTLTVCAAVGGVLISLAPLPIHVPAGPAMVLLLFSIFVVVYGAMRLLRPSPF